MMSPENVRVVRIRAIRVARLCKELLNLPEEERKYAFITGNKLTGELRRASMDLTRALAKMRRGNVEGR